MLSLATQDFIESLSKASRAAYPEGGMVWKYVEASNQAHTAFKGHHISVSLDAFQVEQLAKWIQWSQADRTSSNARSIEAAQNFVKLLRSDLGFDKMIWSFVDHGSDMTATIQMARVSDNRYFSIELFWSED